MKLKIIAYGLFFIKVMELETQVQVSGNQLRRQDEDNKAVREQLELADTKQRDLVVKLREQQNKYTDLESKVCFTKARLIVIQLNCIIIYLLLLDET